MSTILVISTTIRPEGADYFTDTIKVVSEQLGASEVEKIVYSDGPFDKTLPEGWTLVKTEESVGTLPSLKAIANIAKEKKSDLLMLEDDLILAPDAVSKMLSYEVPDNLAFVSFFDFYTPAGHADGLEERGFETGKPLQSGVQAVKFPLRSLEYLWNPKLPMLVTPVRKPGEKETGRLAALKYFFGQLSPTKKFGMHFPHLVQHVDGISAVNGIGAQKAAAEGRKRVSNNFAG